VRKDKDSGSPIGSGMTGRKDRNISFYGLLYRVSNDPRQTLVSRPALRLESGIERCSV
jgi:hypothetical protein